MSFVAGNIDISSGCFTESGICMYKSVLIPCPFKKVLTVPLNFEEHCTCIRQRAEVVFTLGYLVHRFHHSVPEYLTVLITDVLTDIYNVEMFLPHHPEHLM
jgi:hypothetical protein